MATDKKEVRVNSFICICINKNLKWFFHFYVFSEAVKNFTSPLLNITRGQGALTFIPVFVMKNIGENN